MAALLAVLLTVLFIALKLIGIIAWSWWLCWTPVLILVGFLLFMFALGVGIAWAAAT